MDNWKSSFLEKLHEAQAHHAKQYEQALDQVVLPAFEDLAAFLSDNGFKASTPVSKKGRRLFKYELAENAYLLMHFLLTGVGEFELRTETFVPGADPILDKSISRVVDIDKDWAYGLFQRGLDRFVNRLANQKTADPSAELAAV